ncbi:autotransporter outer membrane beta-barrel domain-containing protein, partial [Bosea sp. 2YAB26]|uniref:autotransporter outer membrane beta-barrel domain-containing protein n=1 Tax=Bosea sp. 2YAB26 TaxID=3237478 RepID=UPI003F8DABD4
TTLPAPRLAMERFTLWGEAIGAQGRTDGDRNAASLDRRGGGMLFGAELNSTWSDAGQWRFGIAGGYTRTDFDVDGRRSSGELGSAHGALYGGMRFGAVSLRAGAAYAWSDLDVTRRVTLPGISDVLRFDGRSATAQAFA